MYPLTFNMFHVCFFTDSFVFLKNKMIHFIHALNILHILTSIYAGNDLCSLFKVLLLKLIYLKLSLHLIAIVIICCIYMIKCSRYEHGFRSSM